MKRKIESNINAFLLSLKKVTPKLSNTNLRFETREPSPLEHHSFHEVAKKVITIKRSLSAMGYKFKMLQPSRLRGGAISRVKLAQLRKGLSFRVIVEFRNEMKILYYSKQEIATAPGTLFGWVLKDIRSKLLPSRMILINKFENGPLKNLTAAKMNADIKGIVEVAEFIGDDIANDGEFQGTIRMMEDLKQFLNMRNTSIKEYHARVELLRDLEDRIRAGEEVKAGKLPEYSSHESVRLLEDDFHIDEEIVHLGIDMDVTNRYRRSFTKAQQDQLEYKTLWAEDELINQIREYNLMYQRERTIFQAIEKADEHIINKLEDEVSVMTQKYEYECDEYDLEINRKKNEILASIDKLQTMKKKYEETKEEIGDQVPREIEQPTVWTVLSKLVEIRLAKKLAEEEAALLRKLAKKKGKKGQGADKEADKASAKDSQGVSEKLIEKVSVKSGKQGIKKNSTKGSKKAGEKAVKKVSGKAKGKPSKSKEPKVENSEKSTEKEGKPASPKGKGKGGPKGKAKEVPTEVTVENEEDAEVNEQETKPKTPKEKTKGGKTVAEKENEVRKEGKELMEKSEGKPDEKGDESEKRSEEGSPRKKPTGSKKGSENGMQQIFEANKEEAKDDNIEKEIGKDFVKGNKKSKPKAKKGK